MWWIPLRVRVYPTPRDAYAFHDFARSSRPSSVSIGSVDDSLDEPGNERTPTGTLPVNRSLGIRVRSCTRFCVRNLSSASGSGTVTLYCPLTSLPLLPRVLAHVGLRSYGIFSLSTLASLISLTSCASQ